MRPSRLAELTRALPFAVDDYGAASRAYARWRETGTEADRKPASLWAYCYVERYFRLRFAHERTGEPSDYDAVVAEATRRVFRAFGEGVDHPDRFPQYVSVVCKNVLRSYRDRRRDYVEADEEALSVAEAGDGLDPLDRPAVRGAVARAIDTIPASLADVARLRLLEGLPYAEIADALGLPPDTARTYHSKALRRLRDDPDLRALWFGESETTGDPAGSDGINSTAGVRSGDVPGLDA